MQDTDNIPTVDISWLFCTPYKCHIDGSRVLKFHEHGNGYALYLVNGRRVLVKKLEVRLFAHEQDTVFQLTRSVILKYITYSNNMQFKDAEDSLITLKQLFEYIEPRRYFSTSDARAMDIIDDICKGIKTIDIANKWDITTARCSQAVIKLMRKMHHLSVTECGIDIFTGVDKTIPGIRKNPEFWLCRLEDYKASLKNT